MGSRKELANAIRVLSMDAVEKANSGHPGAPMGMADMAEALWNSALRHNPQNPDWANRDRFVLSNGHASMLLYSLLHLSGYALSMDDIKNFRQMHAKTAGHPEYGMVPGIEMTTGPLGQGIASAVGMALAERLLAKEFNTPEFSVVAHYTYTFLGDGCLMEGISHEACSLAGTLGLGKLVVLYDSNNISIDGEISPWFAEDVAARYEAYGWQVIRNVDGHNGDAVAAAIAQAKAETSKPSLICCKTTIGYTAPTRAGTAKAHGSPLGAEEIAGAKKTMGWTAEPFTIPADIYKGWNANDKGAAWEKEWNDLFAGYSKAFPEKAALFTRRMKGELPKEWATIAKNVIAGAIDKKETIATRIASQKALEAFAESLPELLGGSADLTGSVGTWHKNSKHILPKEFAGNYVSYGVREFAMSAMMNGIALHGGFIPYAGTFLIFSDYAKNAIRLAALMKKRAIWVLTHDSIGVGEDGPTHQPIEQVGSLRLTPNVQVWRPCDTVETAVAWKHALQTADAPTCMVLTRQNLKFVERTAEQVQAIERGGYVLVDCAGDADIILMASGSEVDLALEAGKTLTSQGKKVRVVSFPSTTTFDKQDASYKEQVLPAKVRCRLAIEAAAADSWWKYVGLDGTVVGMTTYGESAPAKELFKYFGLTVDNVVQQAQQIL